VAASRTASAAQLAAAVRSAQAAASLSVASPHLRVAWRAGGVHAFLLHPSQRPLASVRIDRVEGIFANVSLVNEQKMNARS
jgi:hypothetical protein